MKQHPNEKHGIWNCRYKKTNKKAHLSYGLNWKQINIDTSKKMLCSDILEHNKGL